MLNLCTHDLNNLTFKPVDYFFNAEDFLLTLFKVVCYDFFFCPI